jgi:hypothetical protein
MAAEMAADAAAAAAAAEAAGDEAAAAQAAAAAADAAAQAQAAAAALTADAGGMQGEDATQQGCCRQLRERSAAVPGAGAIAAGTVCINPSGTGGRPVDCLCWYTKDVVVRRPGEAPHDLLKRLNYGHLPYESRAQVRLPGRPCN